MQESDEFELEVLRRCIFRSDLGLHLYPETGSLIEMYPRLDTIFHLADKPLKNLMRHRIFPKDTKLDGKLYSFCTSIIHEMCQIFIDLGFEVNIKIPTPANSEPLIVLSTNNATTPTGVEA